MPDFLEPERAGVDTIYKIGEEVLRNPDYREIDSLVKSYRKGEPDSVFTLPLPMIHLMCFRLLTIKVV